MTDPRPRLSARDQGLTWALSRILGVIVRRELELAKEGKLKGELVKRRFVLPAEEKSRRNAVRRQDHGEDWILLELNQAVAAIADRGDENPELKAIARQAAWSDPEFAERRLAILASWWGDWILENDT